MDLSMLNWSEVARRVGVSPVYVHHLITGQRRSEKRIKQIAGILEVRFAELQEWIRKNTEHHGRGDANTSARPHKPTTSRRSRLPHQGRRHSARNLRKQ